MRITVFINSLGLGGTEKAAAEWAVLLKRRNHQVSVVTLENGPRKNFLIQNGIDVLALENFSLKDVANCIEGAEVIHVHAPGFPHKGDVLGKALKLLPHRIPVVQTNIFGKLENPAEDEWTDFRLFISWTSCVQAARRSGTKLDKEFFRKSSVAVYPVADPIEDAGFGRIKDRAAELRETLGMNNENVLFGRFSRPEPNKWSPLVLEAFLHAYKLNPDIRLFLREPPESVASDLIKRRLAVWGDEFPSHSSAPVILMRATSDAYKLAASQLACDVILHTSSIGESFGYGIAEPMALGRPIITHSVPWHDQAQLELVRHEECGLIANCQRTMSKAIQRLANDDHFRAACGQRSRTHILHLANPSASLTKLETAFFCAVEHRDNPYAEKDLLDAKKASENLDRKQWGNSLDEFCYLKSRSVQIGFLDWQRKLRGRLSRHR